MNSIFKSISIIISVIILVFFLIFTFFIGNNDEVLHFDKKQNLETGLFLLEKNTKINKSELNKILKEKINFLDTIYSINYNKNYKKDLGKKFIEIYKGIFLFDFRDINNSYLIKDDFFSIKNLGAGMFFLNNSNSNNIIIYNFDSVLKINFLENNKIKKAITIFPHTFLAFSKNKIINKTFFEGDFYRMKDFIQFKYIEDSYLEKIEKNLQINKNFLEDLRKNSYKKFIITTIKDKSDYFSKQKIFLEKVLNNILEDEKNNINIIDKLKNLKIGNIFERNSLINYEIFLFNKNKIEVYKKNEILRQINSLFLSKTKNLNSLENKILVDLQDLKKIDKVGYEQLKQIIKSYYFFLIKSNKLENIENRKIFFDLVMKLDNKKIDKTLLLLKQNFEELNSIYNSKDFYKIDKNQFLKNFYNFSTKFLKLNIKNKEIIKDYSIFLFEFLKNNLVFDNFNVDTYIDLLKIFTDIKNNSLKSKSQLEEYVKFLEQIKIILKSNFFDGRDDKGRLIFKEKKLQIDKVELLDRVIETISDYVKNNFDLLNEDEQKDKIILDKFNKNFEILKELISALKDPLDYTNNYKNNFESILEKNKTQKKLTKQDCENYFKENFEGLDLSSFTCKVLDGGKYEIKNLKFQDKNISFILNPSIGNIISNIILTQNGKEKKLRVIYSLDDRKQEYALKKKHSNQEKDKKKYDFRYFFQNTFSKQKQEEKIIEEKNIETQKEPNIVIKLKRTRLLGEDGELKFFEGKIFKSISYNWVKVKYENNNFDIFLDNIPLYYKVNDKKTIYGLLSANYVLNEDKPYFRNIKIIFIGKDKDKKNLLGNNYLKVVGKIYYKDFEQKIKKILSQYDIVSYLYQKVKNILGFDKLEIKYNLITKTLEINIDKTQKQQKNIDSTDKMIRIKIKDGKIKSLKNIYDELIKKDDNLDYKEIDSFLEALTTSEVY